jgi:tRNA/rRNA methyltransferase
VSTTAAVVVVLVEPAGASNVGSVARLCANFELSELRLVAPRCDASGAEARRMAMHGGSVLAQARRFASLAEALADCRRVVAATGRGVGEPLPVLPLPGALDWLLAEPAGSLADQPGPDQAPRALVFGREDRGLSNDELLQAGRLLRIETGPDYASLNLSHAAAVVLHALHHCRRREDPPADVLPEPSRREELEGLLSDAEALLLAVGFLYPHTAQARLTRLRALLQRAQVSSSEVALLRGMVRQLRWASRQTAGTPGAQQRGPS